MFAEDGKILRLLKKQYKGYKNSIQKKKNQIRYFDVSYENLREASQPGEQTSVFQTNIGAFLLAVSANDYAIVTLKEVYRRRKILILDNI